MTKTVQQDIKTEMNQVLTPRGAASDASLIGVPGGKYAHIILLFPPSVLLVSHF